MAVTIALADSAARDPTVTGTKAARLAEAAGAGLPVLPGRVLPLETSSEAIARGVAAIEAGSGHSRGYLAAMESVLGAELVEELAPSRTPGSLVARSSTLLDDDGRWSGAFASYLGIGASELPIAVRGCWASAFTNDALARCRESGIDVGSLRIGVLVQPFQAFEAGGTARVSGDQVVVTAAFGGPAGVVSGREGVDVTVGADGRVPEGPGDAAIGPAIVEPVAALARRAIDAVGPGVIEWGAIGGELCLLQIGPIPTEVADARPSLTSRGSLPPEAERLAQLVAAFGGPVGDELVLPWAIGCADVPDAEPIGVDDPVLALREARTSVSELAIAVWRTSAGEAQRRAAAVCRLLLEGRVTDACREIRGLRAPDTAAARRVIGLFGGIGAFLTAAGLLPSAPLVWRLTVSELERAISGERPSLRRGPGRWEPFVADVVCSRGIHVTGTPVSQGIAAGRPNLLRELGAIVQPRPREVLVTPLPLPHLAPLLWHSAALVTTGENSGAHLFEVARSLGVPAVMGVDATVSEMAGSLVAVDGDQGVVSVLPPGEAPRVSSSDDVPAVV